MGKYHGVGLRFGICLTTIWMCWQLTPVSAQEVPQAERIKQAIEQLGSDSFNAREAAQRDLLKLVSDADDSQLVAATESKDVEVARRAQFVRSELQKRNLDALATKLDWSGLTKRIARHAENDDWKSADWRDEVIERSLSVLLQQLNAHVANPSLELPQKIAHPGGADAAERPGGPLRSALLVGRGFHHVPHAQQSVLLIDGSVDISHATNCVIIATGGVTISHSNACVVIAGEFVSISMDGSGFNFGAPRAGETPRRSLVMSGGPLHMSHAQGTVRYSPLAQSNWGSDCVLVNSKLVGHNMAGFGPNKPSTEVNHVKLGIVPRAMPNRIANQLNIKQTVDGGDSTPGFVIVEQQGVETVLRPDKEICDNQGQPIPALAGWKLQFVARNYALFSNGKEYAGFAVEAKK
jgi:hypothetical protein